MPVAKIDFKIPRPDFSKLVQLMPKGPSGNARLFLESILSNFGHGYLDERYKQEHRAAVCGFINGVFSTGFLTSEQYSELCKEAAKAFGSFKELS